MEEGRVSVDKVEDKMNRICRRASMMPRERWRVLEEGFTRETEKVEELADHWTKWYWEQENQKAVKQLEQAKAQDKQYREQMEQQAQQLRGMLREYWSVRVAHERSRVEQEEQEQAKQLEQGQAQ